MTNVIELMNHMEIYETQTLLMGVSHGFQEGEHQFQSYLSS